MKVSDNMHLRIKKGKNFKEVIADEQKKGRTFKLLMKKITGISQSVIYGSSFLLFFVVFDLSLYMLLVPTVFVWAGLLVVSALASSILASRMTKYLKKQQWKYSSYT
jgi:hypothetical protein